MKIKVISKKVQKVSDGFVFEMDENQLTGESQIFVIVQDDSGKFYGGGHLIANNEDEKVKYEEEN